MELVDDRLEKDREELIKLINKVVPPDLMTEIENSTQFLHLTTPMNTDVVISAQDL